MEGGSETVLHGSHGACRRSHSMGGSKPDAAAYYPTEDEEMGRPIKEFEGFVGQRDLIMSVEKIMMGCHRRGVPLPHILLAGPPGNGKTSLACAFASAFGSQFKEIPSTTVSPRGVAEALIAVGRHDIVFIDEAHVLREKAVMTLVRAMDTLRVPDPDSKQGTETREIQPFTLIVATNRPGELNKAFRSRFTEFQIQDYTKPELVEIARRVAEKAGVTLTAQAARVLADKTDSPRVIGKWVSLMVTTYSGLAEVNQPVVEAFLRVVVGLDEHGLTERHRRYVMALARHNGRAKTQNTLVVDVGCDRRTVAEEIEPELIRKGLIDVTDRGRVLTADGLVVARSIAARRTR